MLSDPGDYEIRKWGGLESVYVCVCVCMCFPTAFMLERRNVWMVGLNNPYAWYFIHKGYTTKIMLTSSSGGILREDDVRNDSHHNLCYKPNMEKYYTFVMCHNGFSICCRSKGLNSLYFFKRVHHTFCIYHPCKGQELCCDWSDNCTTVWLTIDRTLCFLLHARLTEIVINPIKVMN